MEADCLYGCHGNNKPTNQVISHRNSNLRQNLKIRFHGALDLGFLNISTKFYVDRIMRSWVTIVWNSYVWVFCTSEIAAFKDFVTLGALFIHFTINYAKLCFISVANWINTFLKIRIMKIDPVLFPQLIFIIFVKNSRLRKQ